MGVGSAQAIREELRRAWARERVHGAYLLEGPAGTGKRVTAVWLARLLLRGETAEPPASADDVWDFPAHPDLHVLRPEGAVLRVEQVRTLRRDLALVPNEGGRRVAVILQAERLRGEAANALLKTLEEPPAGATLVLVAEHSEGLPRTVRSRTTRLRFTVEPEAEVARRLAADGMSEADAELAAAVGGGSVASARAWAASQLETASELREVLERVGALAPDEILDVATRFRGGGEEVRERMQLFLDVYAAVLRRSVERAVRAGDRSAAERALDGLEQGERAHREWRRRNTNAQLVVEGLLLDLRGPGATLRPR